MKRKTLGTLIIILQQVVAKFRESLCAPAFNLEERSKFA